MRIPNSLSSMATYIIIGQSLVASLAPLFYSLYEQFGLQFAERLDGDFSCALLDSGELILTRDTTSVKPLYYDYKGGEFYFASEAKTVTEIAQEVKEFPPGYIYIPKLGFQRFTPRQVRKAKKNVGSLAICN